MLRKRTIFHNNQAHRTTRMLMNYLERIERNIKREFPDITLQELNERLTIIRHMIALNHEKKRTSCPKEETQCIDLQVNCV